jgi:hypothetical protein
MPCSLPACLPGSGMPYGSKDCVPATRPRSSVAVPVMAPASVSLPLLSESAGVGRQCLLQRPERRHGKGANRDPMCSIAAAAAPTRAMRFGVFEAVLETDLHPRALTLAARRLPRARNRNLHPRQVQKALIKRWPNLTEVVWELKRCANFCEQRVQRSHL